MTIAEERERAVTLSPSLIIVVLICAVLAAGTPVVYSKFPDYLPDYLIQIPATMAGCVYTIRYRLLDTYRSWMLRGILLLSFIVPLQNTFLLKAFRKYFLDEHLLLELFRPAIILLLVMTASTLAVRRKADVHPMIVASFFIGIVGWAVATAASQYPGLSLAGGFFEFLCPFLAVYVLAANIPDRGFLLHCLTLFIAGFLLVTISQTAWMLGSIWSDQNALELPIFANEFLEVKKNLQLMIVSGDNGYGNTDNYVSLWALIVPLTAGLYYMRGSLWWVASLYVALYCGLLVYSRAGMIAIMLGLGEIIIYRALVKRKASVMVTLTMIVLFAIHMTPPSIQYMQAGVESALNRVTCASKSTCGRVSQNAEKPHLDESGIDRMIAMQRGIEITSKHPIAGIGYGAYAIADSELTAPHNMIILRWAEGGILSAISFLMLAIFSVFAAIRLFMSRSTDAVKIACAAGLGGFMFKAAVFGATFAIGGQIAWGYAVALMVTALMKREEVSHA